MLEKEVNINDDIYTIIKLGTFRDGFDIQIVKYKVQYKGVSKFIPYGFQDMSNKYQEISYSNCYKTLDEVKQVILKSELGNSYEFIERYDGNYYDVRIK